MKYRVEVEQMEVSQPVFEFLEGIRDQVDNASSIFQPPFFELKGNIQVTGGNGKVVGIFSAAAVARKSIYILRRDVPHDLPESILGNCRTLVPNSSNQPPPFWQ